MSRLSRTLAAAALSLATLVQAGYASAADLEALGEEVRKRVKERSGITLEWEIKRVGVA